MIIHELSRKFEDTLGVSSERQVGVDPDVIEKINSCENVRRVVIPEKFKKDIEALERYIDSSLTSGVCITVTLQELLCICPRERRRKDAYNPLVNFLKEEMNITLTINSQKK